MRKYRHEDVPSRGRKISCRHENVNLAAVMRTNRQENVDCSLWDELESEEEEEREEEEEDQELDPESMNARYEQTLRERQNNDREEDFSDMVAEHAAKQKTQRKRQQQQTDTDSKPRSTRISSFEIHPIDFSFLL